MKIITFADAHIGISTYSTIDPKTNLNTRVLDSLNGIDQIINYAEENNIKYILFAGDMFKNALPSPTLVREINKRIKASAEKGIKWIIQDGNHDVSPLETAKSALDPLSTLKVENVEHTRFEKTYMIDNNIRVLVLPTYTTQEEVENILSKYNDNIKTIVMGHFTSLNAKLNDWLIASNEDAIDIKIFQKPNILAVVLGHLHKHQILNTNPLSYYCSSTIRTDFNEEHDKKGFVVLDIDNNYNVSYIFKEIKTQEFLSVKMDLVGEDDAQANVMAYLNHIKKDLIDKVVRVQLTLDKENNIDDNEILEFLKNNNVSYIANISKIFDREQLIRNKDINEQITEEEALREYFKDNSDKDEIIKLGISIINEMKEKNLI
ncbi:MAG: metallophosphoesterase [Candidatus Onthovivens sp.]|nr:metallophosphoesterase [Candidatus Onthovivens sp.]